MDGNLSKSEFNTMKPVSYAEPVPTWSRAKRQWTWAWGFHTYGFGSLFLITAIMMFISVLKLHNRCRNHKYVVTLNSMLLVCGMCRGFYLIIDPYWSTKILPKTFSMVLFGVGHPSLTSAFSLLQWAFLRITQVKLGPWRFPSYQALSIFIFFHFSLVISIDVAVSLDTSLKLMLIVTESMFILWGFILCGIFIFKGFKITQFTSETQKALKQLSMYNHFRNDPEAFRKDGVIKRVKRPKIRITNDEEDTLSIFTESSSGCSDSSIISCHVTRFNIDKDSSADERARNVSEEPEEVNLLNNAKLEIIMTEDNITVIDRQSSPVAEPATQDSALSSLNTTLPESSNGSKSKTAQSLKPSDDNDASVASHVTSPSLSEVCSSLESGSVYTADDDFANSQFNASKTCAIAPQSHHRKSPATDIKSANTESAVSARAGGDNVTFADHRSSSHGSLEGLVFQINNCFEMQENSTSFQRLPQDENENVHDEMADNIGALENVDYGGYMADTEAGSPRFKARKDSIDVHSDDSKTWVEQTKQNCALKTSESACSTISFYRIRQGRMLHKLVKICYLTTMFQFILCILQLYAMFGVYGVLAKTHKVDPWPWYSFHTCFRLAELGMCSTMAYVTYSLGRYRHRASERKRRKNAAATVIKNKTAECHETRE
ncbi:uncharacterized protein LOC141909211 [Tubulanus polymorphus]|uniref:uncharacterized protein LOC141909211 n=1 Tax=Tubulanus polymorphus TaxID=672921 RepID=UPI003DA216B7